jgi:ankyrin repeat protein
MTEPCNCPPNAGPLHQAIDQGDAPRVRALLAAAGPDTYTQHNLDQGLMIACLNAHVETVELLLNAGADVHARSDEAWTPLMHAARGGSAGVVEILLERGADVKAVNNYDRTALIEAAWSGCTEAVRTLIAAGSDVNHRPSKVGGPAIGEAAFNNCAEVVKLLLEAGAELCVREGQEPLLVWAADRGHERTVCILLDRGIDVEDRTVTGTRPLHRAASGGHVTVARLLLERGAQVDARDGEAHTPLIAGAWRGIEIVQVLLDHGAGVNAEDSRGETALCVAARQGDLATMRLLLERGAHAQPRRPLRAAPLEYAAMRGCTDAAALLLELPTVDVNYRARIGATALALAARGGHVDLMRRLLGRGADPAIPDERGDTPAIYAASAARRDALGLLAEAGADLLGAAPSGRTPLDAAVQGENAYGRHDDQQRTVAWLLDRGSKVDAPSRDATPLMRAIERGNQELVRQLIARGADVNARTPSGDTPLSLAAGEGLRDERRRRPTCMGEDRMAPIVDLLLESGADPAPGGSAEILRLAAACRCPDVVKRLVEVGAPVDPPKGVAAFTPLMAAVGNVKIVRYLLKQGADPNARSPIGDTALHAAVHQWQPCVDVLKILVRGGAEVDAPGRYGDTPLHAAARTHTPENVEALLALGAQIASRNDRGQTPLDSARESHQAASIEIIERAEAGGRFS